GDVDRTFDRDAGRSVELRRGDRAIGVPALTTSGDRRDAAESDFPDGVVARIRNVDVAAAIDRDAGRVLEFSDRAATLDKAAMPGSGERCDGAVLDLANPVV